MFIYTGNNTLVAKVVSDVNTANKNGSKLVVTTAMNYNGVFNFLRYQTENIEAFRQDKQQGARVVEWAEASPKGTRTLKSYNAAQKSGVIVTSEYYRARYKFTMTPVSPELSPEGRFRTDVVQKCTVFSYGGGVYWRSGRVYPTESARYTAPITNFPFKVLTLDWNPGIKSLADDNLSKGFSAHGIERDGEIYFHPVHKSDKNILDLSKLPLPTVRHYLGAPPEAILECVKRQRAAQFDALTAIGEMQTTIEGLASNVLRLTQWLRRLRMMASAKRRLLDVTLSNPFQDSTLSEKHRLHVGKYKHYQRVKRKEARRYQRFKERTAKDYKHDGYNPFDRLTSHWLDAQYGIFPAVMTIVDLLKVLEKQRGDFVRASVEYTVDWELPRSSNGWELVGGSNTTGAKVWSKSRAKFDGVLDDLTSYATINPALTFWELVPLSFVVDWVYDVGDILSTLMKPASVVQEVYLDIQKQTIAATYELMEPKGAVRLRAEAQVFSRSYIDISDRFLITPHVDLSWRNYVTAFSLLWAKARGNKISKGSLT